VSPRGELNQRRLNDSALLAALRDNMTSSTKPEEHNVFHYRQKKTKPRSNNTYRKFGEIWNAIFEICEQTDRQTDADRNTPHMQYFSAK